MIEKILRLQRRLEPEILVRPGQLAGELAATRPQKRAFRRVILYSPAFGESLPGQPFPPWLIPAKLRPPDCPEWKQFCRVRSELTEDDLLDDDPFSRCLRPSLRDPRRLNLLICRKDIRPGQIDKLVDGEQIALLTKRRDLYPADLKRMGRKIRSALIGRVPPMTENAHAAALNHKAMGLLGVRPDVRPEHLTSMIETMRRQTENQPEVELPKVFAAGVDHMQRDGTSSVAEARHQAQAGYASASASAGPVAASSASSGTSTSSDSGLGAGAVSGAQGQ